MTQTDELGPLGAGMVALVVAGYLFDKPSILASTPTVRWILMGGMVGIAIGGVVVTIRDL